MFYSEDIMVPIRSSNLCKKSRFMNLLFWILPPLFSWVHISFRIFEVCFLFYQSEGREWAVKFKNSLLKKVCGQWFYTKVWRSENRKRTHAGAWESNEWTKQEISLDQLVLPAQDKTRQENLKNSIKSFEKKTFKRWLKTCFDFK